MDDHEQRPLTRGKLRAEEWDALLSALDPDREVAARKYETARCGLIAIFRASGFCADAEEVADETLDRVARRTYEKAGTEDAIVNVIAYIRAVARRVGAEFHRRPRLVPIDEAVTAGTSQDVNPISTRMRWTVYADSSPSCQRKTRDSFSATTITHSPRRSVKGAHWPGRLRGRQGRSG